MIITGDCHGHFEKLNNKHITTLNNGIFPEHVIITGDSGIIFSTYPLDKEEKHWIDWLNEKPYKTLVVLGNHENFNRIYRLPLVDLYGGKAYQLSDKIYFLRHGDIFWIEEKKCFVFGGATSIDKEQRRNQITWWPEEVPNYADEKRAFDNLESLNFDNSISIVLTHTAPTSAIIQLDPQNQLFEDKKRCHVSLALEAMMEKIPETAKWYCGHMHEDIEVSFGNRKIRFLYKDLIKE